MPTNNLTRFRKEDYKESPSWWDRAIYNLNLIIDYLFALNVSVTNLSTSFSSFPVFQTQTVTFTSASDSTTQPQHNTYSFSSTLATTPKQLLTFVTNSSNPVFTSPVWSSWHFVNGIVYIDAITGLANSTQYNFTFTIF